MKQMAMLAAAAFCVLLWLAVTAQAQCSTVCSNYIEGECSEHTTTCAAPAPPRPDYGAIAYGRKSGAWGYSYNWDTKEDAENNALKNCAANGDDCEVTVWYQHECGAVASAAGDAAYWGVGDGTGDAGANALASCKKDGGKNCKIEVAQCSR
ncbi:MAG TPA: DUF4189 domain-containing protein [Stellaceae bacterium]|jgi:serine/threonine-protein kinase|nr:DUF4189 domain-containing protein [Stellaceae bacterium]